MTFTSPTASRFDQLTSLRFVAAFLVLLSHLVFLDYSSEWLAVWLYRNIFSAGGCGVSFFYILSGFVISFAYGEKLANGEISFLHYSLLRIARIAPLHWMLAVLFIVWLVYVKGKNPSIEIVVLNLLLLQSWIPDSTVHYSLNAVSWSLSNELFFYVAFPLLIKFNSRRLLILFVAGIFAITCLSVYSMITRQFPPATIEWIFYINPLFRLTDFLAGIILYRLHRAKLSFAWMGTAVEIGLLLTWPTMMYAVSVTNVPNELRTQAIYLPLMALTVFVFACGSGRVSYMLKHPFGVMLGNASFSLYLIHRPMVTFADVVMQRLSLLQHGSTAAVILVSVCVGASLLVYKYIEKPVHEYLKNRLKSAFNSGVDAT